MKSVLTTNSILMVSIGYPDGLDGNVKKGRGLWVIPGFLHKAIR